MHNSPKGRPVEVVAGQPDDVRSRGDQIVRLGGIMRSGYNTISDVLGSGLESDMEGEAIDSLAEVSREIHAELGLAATLYEEVGPYIRNYGLTLGEVKSRMTAIVPAADEAWRAYQGALADYGDAQRVPTPTAALSASPSSTQTSDAEQQRQDDIDDARVAADDARQRWYAEASAFDEQYDTWETAFDTAVSGIRTSTANGIEDDWRDEIDGFVAAAMPWLQAAGVILAVLALVVGGPIVAALALVVGVLSLIGTAWQFSRGDADGWDLALAVIGVIPFGAVGEAFSAFKAGGNGFAAGFRTWLSITPASGNSRLFSDLVRNFADDGARWGTSLMSGGNFFSSMRLSGQGVSGLADTWSAIVSGQSNSLWPVIGDLGSMGEQAMYAFNAVGVFAQSTLVVKDTFELIGDAYEAVTS
jgi:hypothetical protein